MLKVKISMDKNVRYEKAKKGFWNDHVKDYYRKKRPLLKLVQDRLVKDIPSLTKVKMLQAIKKNGLWNETLMDFGESWASWFMEDKENIYFVKLRWADFPLKIMEGIDLMGFQPKSQDLCVGESKTRDAVNISSAIQELIDQLSTKRINKELSSPINEYGSKGWLIEKLLEAKKITASQVEAIYERSKYLRYGFIFHKKGDGRTSYTNAIKELAKQGHPIKFIDYEIEDLEHEIASFVNVLIIGKKVV